MCIHGNLKKTTLEVTVELDACIADEIRQLNQDGVVTVASCCGHGRGEASALIQPSNIDRARALGYTLTVPSDDSYPSVLLTPKCQVPRLPASGYLPSLRAFLRLPG